MGGIRNEQDKKLRAMEIVRRHVIGGEKLKDVATSMKISHDTAQRTLQWARNANLFVQYEQRMFDELLPLAHEAIKLALQDGDAQIALKVMESVGLGPNRLKGQSQAARDDEEGLYGEIQRARSGWTIDVSPGQRPQAALPAGDQIDVVPSGWSVGRNDWDEAIETSQVEIGSEDAASEIEGVG